MTTETEMRQVLGEMEIWLQYGSTTSFAASGGSGDYGRPPGTEHAAHDEWRERFNRAFNKAKVLDDARAALEALRKQTRVELVPETQAELEARVVAKCREGWTVEQVANECRCTTKLVRAAWAVAQADDRKAKEKPVRSAQVEEARRLAGQGMRERQIEMITGLPKTTVRRVLGRAA